MSTLVTDPLVGRTVDGRYDVLRRIARGGMATVYLANDRRLDRRVALKVMHPHLGDGTDVVARFRREARAAARLAHPGIVAVLDQGIDGETSYLTMEYVPGRTLRTEIAGHGALRLGEALRITEGVLDALAAAHRAGLVHRDIKPENVLLTPDGRIKVGDFGLARAVTEATAATTGTLLGTVAYLSPEIVASGEADARADVYAVGIMLYEMITSAPPFEGATPIQVAYRHVHEDVPAPSESVPWLPMDVDDLVAALTARDPRERPIDGTAALTLLRSAREQLGDRAMTLRADVPGRPELLVDAPDLSCPDGLDDLDVGDASHHASPGDPDLTTALDRGPGTGTIALPIGVVEAPADRTGGSETVAVPRPARRRHRGRAVLITLLVLLLVGGGGATAWYYLVGPGSPVTVPAVVGLEQAAAELALEEADLVVAPAQEVFDDAVPAGQVIAVDPRTGTSQDRGTAVTLTVSLGIEHKAVPPLVGLTQAEAELALRTAGLEVGEVEQRANRDVAEGTVLEASEREGTEIPHDQSVDLVVSSGPLRVTIPSAEVYLGKDADAIIADLKRVLDITDNEITVTEDFHDTIPEGSVIAVTPAPGSVDIPQGTPASVVVSKGPELFEVPGVIGRQLGVAREELEDLGFVVEVERVLQGIFGTVRLQSIPEGEWRPKGTVITLTVV